MAIIEKSSHQVLLECKVFGAIINDWHCNGIIRLKVKWISTLMMLAMVFYPLLFLVSNNWLRTAIILSMSVVLIFIWSRPSKKMSN